MPQVTQGSDLEESCCQTGWRLRPAVLQCPLDCPRASSLPFCSAPASLRTGIRGPCSLQGCSWCGDADACSDAHVGGISCHPLWIIVGVWLFERSCPIPRRRLLRKGTKVCYRGKGRENGHNLKPKLPAWWKVTISHGLEKMPMKNDTEKLSVEHCHRSPGRL